MRAFVAGAEQPVPLSQQWERGVPYTDDADRAVTAAWQAQPAWEALPPASRGQLLKDLARAILENRERLARIAALAERFADLDRAA